MSDSLCSISHCLLDGLTRGIGNPLCFQISTVPPEFNGDMATPHPSSLSYVKTLLFRLRHVPLYTHGDTGWVMGQGGDHPSSFRKLPLKLVVQVNPIISCAEFSQGKIQEVR